MLNKNVADYTNFDGKTNKKIVQAPGGLSSISFAWSQEKTDYGPERSIKKKDNFQPQPQPTHNYPPHTPPPHQPSQFSYNETIRVMGEQQPSPY